MTTKTKEGQDLCICKHKEFHHKKTYDGKEVCCMSNCKCEYFINKSLGEILK